MATAELINIDRAAHELRCGRVVNIDGTGFIHPEFIDAATLKKIRSKNARLVITAHRAAAITGKIYSAPQQVEMKDMTPDCIQLIISGKIALKKIKAPALKNVKSKTTEAALEMAHIAQLLPCAILFNNAKGFEISAANILNYRSKLDQSLEQVADAPLKLCDAKNAAIKAFRSPNGSAEHYAIIINKPGKEPLVRIHSSCYTGDLLGSLACDCGDQLRGAIKLMDEAGGGIILYLMQEGRGIGLINKLHAYKLQAQGLDTVEANEFLGFDDEERSFQAAATILKKLGVKKIKLVTNNPRKTKCLDKLGITVTGRVPLVIQYQHNHAYLATKSRKSGHIIN